MSRLSLPPRSTPACHWSSARQWSSAAAPIATHITPRPVSSAPAGSPGLDSSDCSDSSPASSSANTAASLRRCSDNCPFGPSSRRPSPSKASGLHGSCASLRHPCPSPLASFVSLLSNRAPLSGPRYRRQISHAYLRFCSPPDCLLLLTSLKPIFELKYQPDLSVVQSFTNLYYP